MITRALLLTSALLPSAAWACPYCAGRGGEGAFGTVALLGVAIASPFLVGAVAFVAIRAVLAGERAQDEDAQ